MNWHTGNIAEAVAESKAKDAIFVVYTQGQNEMTANLDRYLDDPRVTAKLQTQDFVAVKIQGDSASYAQFISLYKVVPVPSIFFIGKSGTPLDIATGIVSGVDELLLKINKVLLLSGKQKLNVPTSSAVANDAQAEQTRRKIAGDDSDPSDNNLMTTAPLTQKAADPVSVTAAEEQESETAAKSPEAAKQAEEQKNDPGAAMSSQPAAARQKSETTLKLNQPLKHAPAAQEAAKDEPQTKKSVAGLAKSEPAKQPAAANQEATKESKELAESAAEQQSGTAAEPAKTTAAEPVAQVKTRAPSPKPAEPTAAALSAAAAAEKRAAAAAAAAATEAEAANLASAGEMASEITSTAVPGPGTPLTPAEETALRATMNVQKQVDKRKKERSDEKKRRDKDNELRRRREGRDAQEQQQVAREHEFKAMQERIRRERQQEQATRERILAQIAADRAELANRAAMTTTEIPVTVTPTTTSTATITPEQSQHATVEETRLQIRLPGGLIRIKDFPVLEPLTTVRNYVREELLANSNIREFTLATSYPRREFKTEDELKTLNDLNLVPNAVLLVLGSSQVNAVVRSRNNVMNILTSVIWAILTPAAVAFDYINKHGFQRLRVRFMQMISNIGWRQPEVEPPRAAQVGDIASRRNMDLFMLRTTSGPGLQRAHPQNAVGGPEHQIKPTEMSNNGGAGQAQTPDLGQQRSGIFKPARYGQTNIRRLADTAKDDDEDKATYNGNSTQQQ